MAKRKKITKKPQKKVKKAVVPQKTRTDRVKRIKIRLVGIGGGAGNIVSEIAQKVKGASFFAVNTDLKALRGLSRRVEKFHFGQNLTGGLGTGMNPGIAEEAAQNEKDRIKKILEGQDLVILIACLGGGVGSGATSTFAQTSKSLGNLTYGIFTLPFKFEGTKKMEIARSSLELLKRKVNAFSLIPNERIFQIIDRSTPLREALSSINKNLTNSLQSLIEIIYRPGLINIDFADFRTIFEGRGRLTYLNSIEIGKGDIKKGIERVIHSPLYPYSVDGAKGVLLNISGQKDLSLEQVNQISQTISNKAYKGAKIIFGISSGKKNSRIKVTLLATGCSKRIFGQKKKRKKKVSLKRKVPQKLNEKEKESHKPKRKSKPRPQFKPKPKKVRKKMKRRKIKIKVSSKSKNIPKVKKREENEAKIRKNAIEIKKEVEKEEAEMLAREKFWETPAFLRRKLNQS